MPPTCLANSLWLDPVPPELSTLSHAELRLCRRVSTFQTIVVLNKGQLGYTGMVISFPQRVAEVVDQLSQHISTAGLILVQIEGSDQANPRAALAQADAHAGGSQTQQGQGGASALEPQDSLEAVTPKTQ